MNCYTVYCACISSGRRTLKGKALLKADFRDSRVQMVTMFVYYIYRLHNTFVVLKEAPKEIPDKLRPIVACLACTIHSISTFDFSRMSNLVIGCGTRAKLHAKD